MTQTFLPYLEQTAEFQTYIVVGSLQTRPASYASNNMPRMTIKVRGIPVSRDTAFEEVRTSLLLS